MSYTVNSTMEPRCECWALQYRPLRTEKCSTHSKKLRYTCERTGCIGYTPVKTKFPGRNVWPVCICGAIAQDHD